jgi:hypothetical protein
MNICKMYTCLGSCNTVSYVFIATAGLVGNAVQQAGRSANENTNSVQNEMTQKNALLEELN